MADTQFSDLLYRYILYVAYRTGATGFYQIVDFVVFILDKKYMNNHIPKKLGTYPCT